MCLDQELSADAVMIESLPSFAGRADGSIKTVLIALQGVRAFVHKSPNHWTGLESFNKMKHIPTVSVGHVTLKK